MARIARATRRKVACWRKEYNEERPHSNLNYRTPAEFAAAWREGESCGKDAPWESLDSDFPPTPGNPAEAAGFPLSHRSGDGLPIVQPSGSNVV
ncbi:MAG: integrase core domain-containing protein [Candidatus Acidiferrales bacterium]